jgi:cytochrome c oxidase assembly protein subunit 11
MTESAASRPHAAADRALRRKLLLLVMFAFSWALIPLYQTICRLSGQTRIAGEDALSARAAPVSMRFDAMVQPGLPWRVRPLTTHLQVRPGIFVTVEYRITNASRHAVVGQAIARYLPEAAAPYIKKIDCFCFRQQAFAAGETRRLPVVFVIDRSLPREIRSITLAYTLYDVSG